MKRKTVDDLGPLQKKMMEILWERNGATIKEIWSKIDPNKDQAYTTFLSAMQNLEKQGWVRHRAEGRSYLYTPVQSRETEGRRSLERFIKQVFMGDPMLLFQQLIQDSRIDRETLDQLKKMIEKRKREMKNE